MKSQYVVYSVIMHTLVGFLP